MAHFLKTVSATFAAGVICGAGALIAFAPGSGSDAPQPQADKAANNAQPAQVAVVSPTSVPCKDQVWPAIDRRCMRWTAEAWTGPNNGAETGKAAEPQTTAPKPTAPPTAQAKAQPPQPETPKAAAPPSAQAKAHTPQPEARQPEARRVEEPRTAAAKPTAPIEKPTAPIETSKQPAPQQAATPMLAQPAPAETRQAETPAATVQPAADESAAVKSTQAEAAAKSAQAEKVRKPHKTRVARSHDRERDREAQYRDSQYRDYRDYYRDSRDGRRVARDWGDDSSEVVTRRYIVRQASPFFLFGGN